MIFDENYSLRPVPHYARKRTLPLALVLVGFTFFSASMHAGGVLLGSFSGWQFVTLVLAGNLILGLYTAVLGYIAASTGLSTHLLAHFSFGSRGSWLPSLLLGGTQIGWFGVGVAMFAIPVNAVIGLDVNLLIVIAGLLMVVTAYFGISALIFLSTIAVPAILLLSGFSVWNIWRDQPLVSVTQVANDASATLSYAQGLSLVIGSFISAGTLTADFARFCRGKKRAILLALLAYLGGNSFMFLIGALGESSIGYSDMFDVMLAQGLLIPAIVILGLNIWTTNDNALYASGLAMANITKWPGNQMAMINGIIGTLLAMWVYNHFIGWLSFLSLAIPPVGGVIITDYLMHRRRYLDFASQPVKDLHWPGLIAVVFGWCGAAALPGVVPVNGLLIASVSYWLMERYGPLMGLHQD